MTKSRITYQINTSYPSQAKIRPNAKIPWTPSFPINQKPGYKSNPWKEKRARAKECIRSFVWRSELLGVTCSRKGAARVGEKSHVRGQKIGVDVVSGVVLSTNYEDATQREENWGEPKMLLESPEATRLGRRERNGRRKKNAAGEGKEDGLWRETNDTTPERVPKCGGLFGKRRKRDWLEKGEWKKNADEWRGKGRERHGKGAGNSAGSIEEWDLGSTATWRCVCFNPVLPNLAPEGGHVAACRRFAICELAPSCAPSASGTCGALSLPRFRADTFGVKGFPARFRRWRDFPFFSLSSVVIVIRDLFKFCAHFLDVIRA